jgi:hypothetical protein
MVLCNPSSKHIVDIGRSDALIFFLCPIVYVVSGNEFLAYLIRVGKYRCGAAQMAR